MEETWHKIWIKYEHKGLIKYSPVYCDKPVLYMSMMENEFSKNKM